MRPFIKVLKALSDETRFRLLDLLLAKNLCGRALAKQLGISEAAVSQHLKILKEAGILEGEKRGYWMHYSIQKETLKEIAQGLERLAGRSAVPTGQCRRLHATEKGYEGKEVKAMCQCCCERPEKLKGKPGECTPEQVRDCHGDEKKHPCEGEKKEGK
jgi:ArsR family transcriptional regulator, arsenate/arsenite/antimonite-responsive transcriptional repressor